MEATIENTLQELRPGRKLPNGAIVLKVRQTHNDLVRVLCLREHNYHPFAVWSVGIHRPLSTFWGHYFESLDDGLAELGD